MTHEVYIGHYEGEVVYVGEGVQGRHKHLNSGVSNVYEANRIHFLGGWIDTEVIPVESKEEARTLELTLINEYHPRWNYKGIKKSSHRELIRSCLSGRKLKTPMRNQHWLIRLYYAASETLAEDGTFVVRPNWGGGILRGNLLWGVANGRNKAEGLSAQKLDDGSYRVTLTGEALDPETLPRLLREKIK